jgi:uncharacterized membrane protein
MALVYGLITVISLGVGDFIAGQITKRVSTLIVVFYAQAFGVILMFPLALISGHSLSSSAVLWGVLAGISLGIGFLLYFHALSLGKMGIVSSVTGILSAMIPVLTGLFIGERPGTGALFAIMLIVIAIIPIAKKDSDEKTTATNNSKVLAQASGAGILIGLFFVFLHIPEAASSMWTVSFTMKGSFIGISVILLIRGATIRVEKYAWAYIIGTGFLQTFAAITYVIGVNIGMMSIVALGGALSALFTVLCARLFINERLSKSQITGICLALTGIVVLVLST